MKTGIEPLSPRLDSRAVVMLTGFSYLCVGLGFSYLDRQYRAFGLESLLWLVWALLGFGAGVWQVRKPGTAGRTLWVVLGTTAFVLALFPGFVMYALPRWICLVLMLVMGARATVLATQRDFYFMLTVIFAVSFMVATHFRADWSLWVYLGPAWVFGGLALAWQHAAGTVLSRSARMALTLGFIAVCFLVTAVLFLFAPRPPTLGFGFLPPGTDTPGLFSQAAGEGGRQPGAGADGSSGPGGGGGAAGQGGVGTDAGGTQQDGFMPQWRAMLGGMRAALADPFMPGWQRGLIQTLIDGAQALLDGLAGGASGTGGGGESESFGPPSPSVSFTVPWLWWLLCLLAAYGLWRRRYRIGLGLALAASWGLARRYPAQSMRLSAQAMQWCLQVHGFKRVPGQSVREHWTAAAAPPLARRWIGNALEIYCETRFGDLPATRQRALHMRQSVQGACDVMLGLVPELAK